MARKQIMIEIRTKQQLLAWRLFWGIFYKADGTQMPGKMILV